MNTGDVTSRRFVGGTGELDALRAENTKMARTASEWSETAAWWQKRALGAEAERDSLRAQLDAMTTEWGVGLGDLFMNRYATRENAEFVVDCRGDMDFRLMSRLVGPWVEVKDGDSHE